MQKVIQFNFFVDFEFEFVGNCFDHIQLSKNGFANDIF